MKRILLAAATLLFPGLVAAQDVNAPLELKGVQIGMSQAQVSELIGEPSYCDRWKQCSYIVSFAGADLSASGTFHNDQLALFQVNGVSDVSALNIALQNKFGVWNAKQQGVYVWVRGNGGMTLSPTGTVMLQDTVMIAQWQNAKGAATASDI